LEYVVRHKQKAIAKKIDIGLHATSAPLKCYFNSLENRMKIRYTPIGLVKEVIDK